MLSTRFVQRLCHPERSAGPCQLFSPVAEMARGLGAASAAASSKELKVRGICGGIRPWSEWVVSVNDMLPNMSVRTVEAAPDCVE